MSIQDEIPKSRLTLKYKTEVNGQPEDVNLPLRLAILGDFSGGTSKDRKLDLDERRMRQGQGPGKAMQGMRGHGPLFLEGPVGIEAKEF